MKILRVVKSHVYNKFLSSSSSSFVLLEQETSRNKAWNSHSTVFHFCLILCGEATKQHVYVYVCVCVYFLVWIDKQFVLSWQRRIYIYGVGVQVICISKTHHTPPTLAFCVYACEIKCFSKVCVCLYRRNRRKY